MDAVNSPRVCRCAAIQYAQQSSDLILCLGRRLITEPSADLYNRVPVEVRRILQLSKRLERLGRNSNGITIAIAGLARRFRRTDTLPVSPEPVVSTFHP